MEDLIVEYHEFLRTNRLNIIYPVPENHPEGLHQYNVPTLYGSILYEAGRKRKAQKTLQNESPSIAQRSPEISAPIIDEQTSSSEQSPPSEQPFNEETFNEFSADEQSVVDYEPVINEQLFRREQQGQPVFNQETRVNEQSVVLEQSITNEQPAKDIATSDTKTSDIESSDTESSDTGTSNIETSNIETGNIETNNNNNLLSFWDQFRGQQQQPRDASTGSSTDGLAPIVESELASADHQPAVERQPLAESQPSYPDGNDGSNQFEPSWNQPLDEQSYGDFLFDGPSMSEDGLANLNPGVLFGEDPTSQQ